MEKINFINNQAPALSATNLNQLQTNIENAINSVVESGTNSNGSWIKFSDGTMICRATKELSNVAITNNINNGSFYCSEELTPFNNFPKDFIEVPYSCTINSFSSSGYGSWILKKYPPSLSNINSFIIAGTWSTTQNFVVSYIATGRWK